MAMDSGTPARQLRVPMEVERINKATDVLDASLSRLADRLNPVLSQPTEAPPTTGIEAKVMAIKLPPLVERLSDLARSVEVATRRIDDLCARLEV